MSESEKRLIYFESEEHLVRRLGAALVVCWSKFPLDLRREVLSSAERVLDTEPDDHLNEHLKLFIAEHCQKR